MASSCRPDLGKWGASSLRQGVGKGDLVGRQVQERQAAAGDGVADVLQHQAAQLARPGRPRVDVARAGDFGVEQLGVGNAEGVVAERAQAHGAKVLVADRDGLGRPPLLVDLLARAEEVHVALEGDSNSLSQFFR